MQDECLREGPFVATASLVIPPPPSAEYLAPIENGPRAGPPRL